MTRRLRPTAPEVIAVLALAVALSGTAVAANGRPAHLGRNNSATRTTTLRDPRGTALIVHSRRRSPPFTVNGNTVQVPSLNVSRLDGRPASSYGRAVEVFSHTGSFTISVPAGLHHALVTASGGGGGGGGAAADKASGGGGQGGTGVVWLTVQPGQHFVAVIGAGGKAGVGAAGHAGAATAVRLAGSTPGSVVSGAGGAGGFAPASCEDGTSAGGAGGSASGPSGDAISAIPIHASPGTDGSAEGCRMGIFAGAGGGVPAGAGSGGQGSGLTDPPTAGSAGYVMIEFFR